MLRSCTSKLALRENLASHEINVSHTSATWSRSSLSHERPNDKQYLPNSFAMAWMYMPMVGSFNSCRDVFCVVLANEPDEVLQPAFQAQQPRVVQDKIQTLLHQSTANTGHLESHVHELAANELLHARKPVFCVDVEDIVQNTQIPLEVGHVFVVLGSTNLDDLGDHQHLVLVGDGERWTSSRVTIGTMFLSVTSESISSSAFSRIVGSGSNIESIMTFSCFLIRSLWILHVFMKANSPTYLRSWSSFLMKPSSLLMISLATRVSSGANIWPLWMQLMDS
ncbi:hypothetical protein OGAPHI_001038 [Ogataea philodendri]|uniref:Uncharacterized protein n=1 Tax=Ogataea philodendri TaxID=1378263 RepID=A0A9P8PE00_9ASCO|nr:uncharacterized protein OGAPHI_001038 [Ogataea philodendri]KAH3670523.1 hypothetical protein OGAPHI_001038 [Ogataea philodendri]